jgi:hypothetical protein
MQRTFPLISASRPALGPTHPPTQWVPGALSPWVKRGRGVMLITHPLLVPRLRKCRSYTSCHPNAPLWSVTGPLYLFYNFFYFHIFLNVSAIFANHNVRLSCLLPGCKYIFLDPFIVVGVSVIFATTIWACDVLVVISSLISVLKGHIL